MRYFVLIMVALSLIACNLVTGSSQLPDAATPTPTDSPQEELGNIAYWYLLPYNEIEPEAEDYLLFEQFVLRRVETDIARTGTSTVDLEQALLKMFERPELWQTNDLTIESVSISDGVATVRLNGEINAVADIIMLAIPVQTQLTVFEDSSINGENIANLGISHSSQGRPADFVYTREELDTYFTP